MDALLQDLRYALRALRSTPIVAGAAIISLTLAIAANTAIFSLISALLLRPLPVREPDRLAMLGMPSPGQHFTYDTFSAIRDRHELFDGAFAFPTCCGDSVVAVGPDRENVKRQYVSGDFFSTTGVPAWRGRVLSMSDDRVDAAPTMMITEGFWRRRFAARDEVVGQPIVMDGIGFTVVGVLPPDFFGLEVGRRIDVVVPVRMAARLSRIPFMTEATWLNIVVRLKHDVPLETALAGLRAAQPGIRIQALPHDLTLSQFLHEPFTLEPFGAGTSQLRQEFGRPLVVVFAVVVLVLLIACVNVGHLLLARGAARRHEISVRIALGASGFRLMRQILLESLVISSLSAGAGLLLSSSIGRALAVTLSTPLKPIALDVHPDWRVLAFAVAVTGGSTLLFGMAPAWRARRVAPIEALTSQGRGVVASRSTISSGLIIGQIVVAMVLAVAAGLLTRTFVALLQATPGFDADAVLVASVNGMTIPMEERVRLFTSIATTVGDVPGVVAAATTLNPPIIGSLVGDLVVTAPGATLAADAAVIQRFDTVTPGYVAAYGLRIVSGRDFARTDVLGAEPVMLVNAVFARQLFPGQNVVGMPLAIHVRTPQGDVFWESRTIVGVVSDVAYRSVRDDPKPMVYAPLAQRRDALPQTSCFLVVRAKDGAATTLIRQVDAAIKSANPDLATTFEPLAQQVDDSLAQDRLVASLSSAFGLLALLLAGVGLYGVTAHATNLQRREIGIRMALGATSREVLGFLMTRTMALVGAAVALGVVVSFWTTRFIATLLFGVRAHDPSTFLIAAVVLFAIGALAAWVPARRAARVDPMIALRAE